MGEAPLAKKEHLLIVMPYDEPTAVIQDLRKSFPDIEVTFYQPQPEPGPAGDRTHAGFWVPKELWEKATILATTWNIPNPRDVPRLKLLHLLTAGADHIIDHPIITDTDITITTSSGIHGPPMAEWTVMNWLVAWRRYNLTYEAQKQHKWTETREFLGSLQDHVGKKVGILGYGSIGRQIAHVAVAMGMTVYAYTASPRHTPESRRDTGYIVPGTGDPDGTLPVYWHHGRSKAALHEFLSLDLDHLVICLPLTPQTTHLLGAEEYSILSSHCTRQGRKPYLTNISRGKTIDQDALIASLESGELSGAALDVTDPEPLPKDHPLWDAPNLQLSPHISSLGIEYIPRSLDVLKVNLGKMEKGERLINVFERRKGY